MPSVNFSQRALSDLDRILEFLVREAPSVAIEAADEIVNATTVLQRHPLIGRPVSNLRELVISRGRSGYVALYRYLPKQDRVDILAIRHQRESGLVE